MIVIIIIYITNAAILLVRITSDESGETIFNRKFFSEIEDTAINWYINQTQLLSINHGFLKSAFFTAKIFHQTPNFLTI